MAKKRAKVKATPAQLRARKKFAAAALAWHFILYDLLAWVQVAFFPGTPALPALTGTSELITVLFSLLGLGGLRTFEKMRGVSREGMKVKASPE